MIKRTHLQNISETFTGDSEVLGRNLTALLSKAKEMLFCNCSCDLFFIPRMKRLRIYRNHVDVIMVTAIIATLFFCVVLGIVPVNQDNCIELFHWKLISCQVKL